MWGIPRPWMRVSLNLKCCISVCVCMCRDQALQYNISELSFVTSCPLCDISPATGPLIPEVIWTGKATPSVRFTLSRLPQAVFGRWYSLAFRSSVTLETRYVSPFGSTMTVSQSGSVQLKQNCCLFKKVYIVLLTYLWNTFLSVPNKQLLNTYAPKTVFDLSLIVNERIYIKDSELVPLT